MEIQLVNAATNKTEDGLILPATEKELPLNEGGWNFSWRKLYEKGILFYKAVLKETPTVIEGLIMVSVIDNKMVYLNNIEVAPHNYGSSGKYKNVAGCLIAFSCLLSIKDGKESYKGFLTFDSKTNLIKLYQEKYEAVKIGRQKMYINDVTGRKLIKQYLDYDV